MAFGETDIKNRIVSVLNYKKSSVWMIVLGIVISIVFAVCFLTNPVSSNNRLLDKITHSQGYNIIDQDIKKVTLTLPVSELPERIYTEDGVSFDETDVIAYQDEMTIIYLKEARYSNEGSDNLYFCFDFTFNLSKKKGAFLYPWKISTTSLLNAVHVADGMLKSDNTEFEHAVSDRGQDGDNKIWFYVSTDVLRQADGTISFDINLNQIQYVQNQR